MALGFIKKVFSLGQKKDEKQKAKRPAKPSQKKAAPAPKAKNYKTPAKAAPQKQEKQKAKSKTASKPAAAQKAATQKAAAIKRPAAKAKPMKAASVQKPAAPKAIKAAVPKPEKAAVSVTIPTAKAARRKAAAPVSFGAGKISIGDILEVIESSPQSAEEDPLSVVKISWFDRLKTGLSRSSRQLGDSVGGILTRRKLDAETLQDLEDILITADLGVETAMRITDTLGSGRFGKNVSTGEVQTIMAAEIRKVLEPVAKKLELDIARKPHVILVVGVNGTGKTTTIGKLAQKLTAGGLSVMLAAGDTFRAAAIEQLHIWGERTGAAVVSSKLGADAASLAYDAYKQAKAAGSDVLIIDTAGRLQNKTELMDELAKIVRVLGKHNPDAPHTVLQTLDATTGQNALNQVDIFRNIAGVNGLVMTKLDGTARGGILVAIAARHKLPVHFIGVGETVDDLESFSAQEFAEAITGNTKT
ncbi:MAG: Signal recognition particle receptor FtsY [Candidatus Tokpelaia hoelldobleri]|uniref:Signal recognition particle receptor FtsY n=1 Tax=Candidatus Tokpelaia hoelldobleri TaxID=1902579 RepID=A0A1U9JX06_9HYPH|nr:MAG: Signal recognition particle receptor FtsY [Candidatus Tokpelaia hoelldoblerii]